MLLRSAVLAKFGLLCYEPDLADLVLFHRFGLFHYEPDLHYGQM